MIRWLFSLLVRWGEARERQRDRDHAWALIVVRRALLRIGFSPEQIKCALIEGDKP